MSNHKQVADELLSLKLELKEVKATNAALHSNLNSKDALIERLESDTEIKRQGNARLAQEVADKQAEICDLTATNAALEDALSHAKCNFGNCDGIKNDLIARGEDLHGNPDYHDRMSLLYLSG
jgi:chromosome segregation ATPase